MLAETITDRAMLVDLTVRQWTASKHDKTVSREVAQNHGNREEMGKYQKKLVAKEAIEEIRKIASEAAAEHRTRTLAWSDSGARILSSAGYLEYTNAMRVYQDRWNVAVAAFVADYPDYIDDARVLLNGLFNPADYPPASQISARFSFGWQVFPVPSADDFRVQLGDDETRRVRDQITASVEESMRTAQREVAERIRKAVEHMAERLRAYTGTKAGSFRDTLVENIEELVRLIPTLNLTNDPLLTEISRRLDDELCSYTIDTLRSSSDARDETAKAADAILAQLDAFI